MRYFNTLGPVNDKEHYVVPRTALVTDLVAQIEKGQFFTIYASRQMGKTTLLRQLKTTLAQLPGYLPVSFSLEDYDSLPEERFFSIFWPEFTGYLIDALKGIQHPKTANIQQLANEDRPADFASFRVALRSIHKQIPEQKLVLILDEFDGVPQPAITPLLQVFRKIYLDDTPPRSLQSVLLVGLQNIGTLNLKRSSPFNIANQLHLWGFSLEQVVEMLAQYEVESGQTFEPGVASVLASITGGHPFLVNRLATILTSEIATDRTKPITYKQLRKAEQQFVRERNFNFESLSRHTTEYRREIMGILFGNPYSFNLNDPIIYELHLHGIIRENDEANCEIANPIYRQVLLAYLRPRHLAMQGDLLINGHDSRTSVKDGLLDMPGLLSDFRVFVERRGREAFKIAPMPQEATGQYLLMAYLESVARQIDGAVFAEAPSGEGFLDFILSYQSQRHIVETKIWRGPKKYDEGLTQLSDYLDIEGQTTGYYVVFHARPNVYGQLTHEELEFVQSHNGKTIYVYIVRLGHVFEDEPDAM